MQIHHNNDLNNLGIIDGHGQRRVIIDRDCQTPWVDPQLKKKSALWIKRLHNLSTIHEKTLWMLAMFAWNIQEAKKNRPCDSCFPTRSWSRLLSLSLPLSLLLSLSLPLWLPLSCLCLCCCHCLCRWEDKVPHLAYHVSPLGLGLIPGDEGSQTNRCCVPQRPGRVLGGFQFRL